MEGIAAEWPRNTGAINVREGARHGDSFAWFAQGLRIIDIKNPQAPREVASYMPDPAPGQSRYRATISRSTSAAFLPSPGARFVDRRAHVVLTPVLIDCTTTSLFGSPLPLPQRFSATDDLGLDETNQVGSRWRHQGARPRRLMAVLNSGVA